MFTLISWLLAVLLGALLGVIGCGLLAIHLVKKKSDKYKWAAWAALILSCTSVLLDLVLIWYIYPLEVVVIHHDPPNPLEARHSVDDITGAITFADNRRNRTTLDPRRLVVLNRCEWLSLYPMLTTPLKHPVEYVIISHTETDYCTKQAECTRTIRSIQLFHVEGRKWMDIAYNFMVAGDGQAYEGRGWDVVGAHTAAGFNGISVGISFVGNFSDLVPPPLQIRACKLLMEEGVKLGKISSNYKLIADRQVSNSQNPGQKFFDELKTWEHWTADV